MIVSHARKFIFIKTNKTAGTSIEIALSRFCEDKDIITPLSPPEDEAKRQELSSRGAQNYWTPLYHYTIKDWGRLLIKRRKKIRFYNHISAREVKQFVGAKVWDSYYKFCFERNPWDRLISFYYWHCRSGKRPTIAQFLESDRPLVLKRSGYELYTIDGRVAVDRICRFENLDGDLKTVCKQLGISQEPDLPQAKSGVRQDKRSYRDILSAGEREKIAELFRDEIELLGYEF